MSSIRSILEELVSNVTNKLMLEQCDKADVYQALKDISELIIPKISDIDRLYTDEYDRELWNEFKHEVQSNLKEALK